MRDTLHYRLTCFLGQKEFCELFCVTLQSIKEIPHLKRKCLTFITGLAMEHGQPSEDFSIRAVHYKLHEEEPDQEDFTVSFRYPTFQDEIGNFDEFGTPCYNSGL